MSTAAYKDWVKDGRPVSICLPARDYRYALQANGWDAVDVGSIGNEEHLQAEVPQDHTPFSVTGWPVANPYPWVHALDVMHDPADGRDVAPLFDYWLRQARAGLTPWVKYLVWQGLSYSVRSGWVPKEASGHYDHAHISFRTDHTRTGIGSWSVIPNGGNDMEQEEANMHKADTYRALATLQATDAVYRLEGEPEQRHEVNELARLVRSILATVEALAARSPVAVDAEALAAILAGDADFVSRLGAAIADGLGDVPSASDIVVRFADALRKGSEG